MLGSGSALHPSPPLASGKRGEPLPGSIDSSRELTERRYTIFDASSLTVSSCGYPLRRFSSYLCFIQQPVRDRALGQARRVSFFARRSRRRPASGGLSRRGGHATPTAWGPHARTCTSRRGIWAGHAHEPPALARDMISGRTRLGVRGTMGAPATTIPGQRVPAWFQHARGMAQDLVTRPLPEPTTRALCGERRLHGWPHKPPHSRLRTERSRLHPPWRDLASHVRESAAPPGLY